MARSRDSYPAMPTESERRWRSLIRELTKSELTDKAFAASRKVSVHSLRWWKSELKRRDMRRRETKNSNADPGFVEVRLSAAREVGDAGLVVELRGGRRIGVHGDFDAAVLLKLVRVLESAPC